MRASISLSWTAFLVISASGQVAQEAHADSPPADAELVAGPACRPECREGYDCIDGQCISACNPPCSENQICTAARTCQAVTPAAATTPPSSTSAGSAAFREQLIAELAPALPPARARFGLFVGGFTLPDQVVTAYAGGAIVSWFTGRAGWEPRLYATLYRVEDDYTITTGAALLAQGTYWWSVYGLGAGMGLGYAGFEPKRETGWSDSSAQVLFYVAPVMLRFGGRPQVELGLKLGSTRFVSHGIEPFGYVFAAIHF